MKPYGAKRRLSWKNANYWLRIAEAHGYLCFKFSDEVEWSPHDMASLMLDGMPSRERVTRGRK